MDIMDDDFDVFEDESDDLQTVNLGSQNKQQVNQAYIDPFNVTQPNDINLEQRSTIMVVDDDPYVRKTIKIALKNKYDVLLCASGDEGVQQANTNVFAVILDIKMEGKDGFQTFKELKEKISYLPIIFHSAYQDLKDPYEIMNDFRPFGYISKEGNPKELLDTTASAVRYSQQILKNQLLVTELQVLNASLEEKVRDRTQELNQTLETLSIVHNEQSYKNKLMEESIDYAKNIQHSLLPLNDNVADMLSDHFVIWRPKDVVGGIFILPVPVPVVLLSRLLTVLDMGCLEHCLQLLQYRV